MSNWFQSYGFAEVFPELITGAYPLDPGDVDALAASGVRRVLNLAQDEEYHEHQRAAVELALARHQITEVRLSIVDFGHLPADRLDRAVGTVVGWMDESVRSYVHCRAGWQRSASVAAGAIAVFNDVDIATALDWVRQHKSTANPLPHQRVDLLDWWLTRGRQQAAAHSAAEARAAADPAATADPRATADPAATADPGATADPEAAASTGASTDPDTAADSAGVTADAGVATVPGGPASDALHAHAV
jgi:predicted protein tyrosine phosphatase